MPRPITKLISSLAILAVSLSFVGGAEAESARDRESAGSVVQVRCVTDQGGSKATGFVWPQPGFVVTALHAVAACPSILVFSEPAMKQSAARLESVLLEADLALLRLSDDMGLTAIAHQQDEPNPRGSYYIWGYPLVEEEMSGKRLDFADGWKGGMTKLGTAFASGELYDLFDAQDYPTEDTQILRVASTIQPGHSGAPILSTLDGRVVAIADGGLLDGWRGVNWSIPAHIYLARLQTSLDPFPKSRPQEKGLFSQTTAVEGAASRVPLGAVPEAGSASESAGSLGELVLVRTISLADLAAIMAAEQDDFFGEMVPLILEQAQGLSPPPDLSFDIYEDFRTGSTIGVPAGLALFWDDEIGALLGFGESDAVILIIGVLRSASYEEARDLAPQTFIEGFSWFANWQEDPAGFAYDHRDDEIEHANHAGFYAGRHAGFQAAGEDMTGEEVSLQISLTVSGRDLLGYAFLSVSSKMTDRDWVNYMMMQLGAEKLSDFAIK